MVADLSHFSTYSMFTQGQGMADIGTANILQHCFVEYSSSIH